MEFMEPVDGIWQSIQDALGGGSMTIWLVVGGLLLAWLAYKAVKGVLRMVMLGGAAALLLGVGPWGGADVEGPAATCAVTQVGAHNAGVQSLITKRVSATEVSADATCNADNTGLASGTAEVKLRTWFDIPFQTWDVTTEGAAARSDLPLPGGDDQ